MRDGNHGADEGLRDHTRFPRSSLSPTDRRMEWLLFIVPCTSVRSCSSGYVYPRTSRRGNVPRTGVKSPLDRSVAVGSRGDRARSGIRVRITRDCPFRDARISFERKRVHAPRDRVNTTAGLPRHCMRQILARRSSSLTSAHGPPSTACRCRRDFGCFNSTYRLLQPECGHRLRRRPLPCRRPPRPVVGPRLPASVLGVRN